MNAIKICVSERREFAKRLGVLLWKHIGYWGIEANRRDGSFFVSFWATNKSQYRRVAKGLRDLAAALGLVAETNVVYGQFGADEDGDYQGRTLTCWYITK